MKVFTLTVFALSCLLFQLAASQSYGYPYYGNAYGNSARRGGFNPLWLLLLLFVILPFLFNNGSSDQVILLNGTLQ